MSIFLGLIITDRSLLLYPISNRTRAALLLMATDECVSFSFRTAIAPVARASEASRCRQLESVSRISSWIPSDSVLNLNTSKGIKSACSMPAAPTGGDRGETRARCERSYSFHLHFEFLNRVKVHVVTHFLTLRDGNYCNTGLFRNAILALLSQEASPKVL